MSKSRNVLIRLGSLLALLWLLAACSVKSAEPTSPATPAQEDEPTVPLPTTTPTTGAGGQGTALPPVHPVFPEPVPTLEPGTTGEVPEALLNAIVEDLVARTGADPASVEVVRAEAVVWSDGSLGCPQPEMMYTQVLVDGYWVVLKASGRDYDYRATQSGYFNLCEGSKLEPGTQPSLNPDR